MTRQVRIATFNVENLDDRDTDPKQPPFATRIAVLRPQLLRINADILCLQEVHGQAEAGQPRQLRALRRLLEGTPYSNYHIVSTTTQAGQVEAERNLVVVSRFEIVEVAEYLHHLVPAPRYGKVTSLPPATRELTAVKWERPILRARVRLSDDRLLDVINVHLKSKHPTAIPGQQVPSKPYLWKSIAGWAEGFFLSSMKRVGQALEVRYLIDTLFDANPEALIVACGDFNADLDDVPLQAIRGDVENTSNPDLLLRTMLPCGRTIPETTRFSLFHLGQGLMYDHILISRSLLPFYRRSEVHNELLHDESAAFADDLKFPESDHAPVIAEFAWDEDV